ncbi:deoxynucleotidyltransferase terminal-interacting protein 2 [Ochotona curzoniae]|uniref:deoxynucleotidyltransferase terminal-interacting protein 2 n=1 Tax=Ochotona curzoniae TaxID=130825 RepID=UPI001B34C519|nr:deoxynucleotidyltransferase terminal-interacting protein 2 [Ochotona curzoniae]
MVVTRSARKSVVSQASTAASPQQKDSTAGGCRAHPENKQKSESDDPKDSPVPRNPKSRKRKNGPTAALPEATEPSDGETSDTESNYSVSETQEPILRITRRRQIVIAPTPVSTRKRPKVTTASESQTEEVVSEAESHTSGVSRVVPSAEPATRAQRSKAKSGADAKQESAAKSCASALFCELTPRRSSSRQPRRTQTQARRKDAHIGSRNEKPVIDVPENTEDVDAKRTSPVQPSSLSQVNESSLPTNEIYNDVDDDSFHINSNKILTTQNQSFNEKEEEQASIVSPKEMKQNFKSLGEGNNKMVNEGKDTNAASQLHLSELQDVSPQGLGASQKHSAAHHHAHTEPSSLNGEAVAKSLVQSFAVVEVDRWNEERRSTIKTNDLTELGPSGESDDEESMIMGVNKDRNGEGHANRKCDSTPRSALSTSGEAEGSVLLVLSSDESQESVSSDDEEDSVCYVERSGQKEALSGKSCDDALFVIDTTPGLSADKHFYLEDEDKVKEVATEEEQEEEEEEEEDESEEEQSDQDKNKNAEFSDEDDLLSNTKSKLLKLTSSSIDPGLSIKQLGGLYINFNANKLQSNKKTLTQIKEKKKNELLQKAVITPEFEKNYCVPPYSESKRQLQKRRRKERQKTAGDGWFGMKAPELTDELKNDLKALKMRASMDPKRFYKKNDRDGFPKYFQVGTIVDNPADFYHSRIPKKQRKKTIVEELLADSEFRRYNRRKYSEIMAEKAANAAGKKFRKKKKFRN